MIKLVECFVTGAAKTKGSLDFVTGSYARENVAGSKEWRRLVADKVRRSFARSHVSDMYWTEESAALTESGLRFATLEPTKAPIQVELVFWLEPPRSWFGRLAAAIWRNAGDIDKLTRNVLDACGSTDARDAHLYADDNQVISVAASKLMCVNGDAPGVFIRVSEYEIGECEKLAAILRGVQRGRRVDES